jgi:gluconate 5-dehydrogenase
MTSSFDLTGRVALVTGSSRGIGLGIAEGLANAGATIVLNGVDPIRLDATRTALAKRFGDERVTAHAFDIVDEDAVAQAVASVESEVGAIDILVNNAGATWGAPALEMPLAGWRKVIDTNITGTFLAAQAAARAMIDGGRGGTIVNIASIAGLVGTDPGVLDAAGYSASKGAVIALTRDLAVKWAAHGVRVNAIAPGFFPSKMTRWLIEHRKEALLATVPMRRLGGEDDLKGAVLFLASRASAFVTGQVLVVDGGATAW